MCVNTQRVFTNSRCISKVNVQRLYSQFKCGYCVECVKQLKNEWRVRSYYESRRVFDNYPEGFCLFDTLTYDQDHVKFFHDVYKPALFNCWDFMCFNRRDLRLFKVRLRRSLTYAGYDVKDNLRMLQTSEYGEKSTERPHYHIIFYVTIPEIDPVTFSGFVSRAWHAGFTDGVRPYDDCGRCPVSKFCNGYCLYKSPEYVRSERVINKDNIHKAINYVTKYITKNLDTYSKYYRRVFNSFSIANPNWTEDYSKRLEFRRFKNQVLPFHTQSSGFGRYALDILDHDKLISDNCISIPVNDRRVVMSIQLPRYYKRSLLFNHVYFNEKTYWYPKPVYYDYQKKLIEKSVNNLSLRYASLFPDVDSQLLYDVAKYHYCYKGVYKPFWKSSITYDDLIHSNQLDWYTLQNRGDCWFNCRVVKSQFTRVFDKKPLCHHRKENGIAVSNKCRRRFVPVGVRCNSIVNRVVSDRFLQEYDPPVNCRCWSIGEFERYIDESVISDDYFDSFVDAFIDFNKISGGNRNVVAINKDWQNNRYKKLGLVK